MASGKAFLAHSSGPGDVQDFPLLPPLIAGKKKACFAVTEPNTGLNTTQLKTFAKRDGDGYLVNGRKVWITTAQVTEKMLLLARTTPLDQVKKPSQGLSLFYTNLDRRYVDVREIEKLGRKGWTPTNSSSTTCRCRWKT